MEVNSRYIEIAGKTRNNNHAGIQNNNNYILIKVTIVTNINNIQCCTRTHKYI